MSSTTKADRMPLSDIQSDPLWIDLTRVRILYHNYAMTMAGTAVCAAALLMLLWGVVPTWHLMAWLIAVTLISFGRIMLQHRFRIAEPELTDPEYWERWFRFSVLCSGMLWGSVSIWLFPATSMAHQSAVVVLLAGITAGALTLYTAQPRAYLAFVIPVLTPLFFRMLITDTPESTVIAAMILFFVVMLARAATQMSRTLANFLSLQARNAELTKALQHQATHDSLVNLVNHGEFQRRLQNLANSAGDVTREYALIFIDLDLFKEVNDSAGHGAGDALLVEIAKTLRGRTRARDTAARVGGDEFAVLLEGCSADQAAEIAEAIRFDIENLDFRYEDQAFKVCASIGVTHGLTGIHRAAAILKAADLACYAAKEAGRNTVRVVPPEDGLEATGRFALATLHPA